MQGGQGGIVARESEGEVHQKKSVRGPSSRTNERIKWEKKRES